MPTGRIPLWIKLAHSAFIAVLVPTYWRYYGLPNFLQLCDVAAFLTLVGLWAESSLLLSIEAVAILVPQAVWVIDFVGRLTRLGEFGMTAYMFQPKYPLWVRGLSLFHGWLPFLLLWAVRKLGYDRRAFGVQVVLGVTLLLACYLAFDPPGTARPTRPVANVNYVFGVGNNRPQTRMPPSAWFGIVVVAAVVGMFLPAHLMLRRMMPGRR
jgi:hypothetical protein